jgi:spermidine synthase
MIRIVIATLFFLSGITGLVYEVVWSKYLTMIFGNTAHAHAIILGVFLGGIAIGNAVLGPRADKLKRPLYFYGWLEILIALCGVIVPKILLGLATLFDEAAIAGHLETGSQGGLRLATALAVLLVPTFLMGGTLPAMSRFLSRSLAQVGRSVSLLYFLNSAGAAIGAFAAGFWLVPKVGLSFAGSSAALANLVIGIAALALSNNIEGKRGAKLSTTDEGGPIRSYSALQVRWVLGAVFVSGFISLAYEIAWIRLLALILGSSSYSFTLMLTAFIAGIAIGSFCVMRWIKPNSDAYLAFGIAEALAGIAILASFPLYAATPFIFHTARAMLIPSPESFGLYQAVKLGICFLLMFIPTLFIGATLPLASAVATRSSSKVAGTIGKVFALNTFGNVLGAALSGLILLRAVGIQDLLEIGAVLNILIGCGVLWTARKWPRPQRLAAAAGIAAILIVHLGASSTWDKRALTRGDFRLDPNLRAHSYREYRSFLKGYEVLYYKDGANATVAITEKNGHLRQLRVNGKVDASNGLPDMITQEMLAHMPLLLRPNAKNVLLIGYGSGVTLNSVLKHPVEKVHVAEISREVIEAAQFFKAENEEPLKDPRVKLHVQDGRTVLKTSAQNYDVIISEPSNPWIAGIADLFSTQFFVEARTRLRPGGVMIQWLQAYETSDEILRMILRTYRSVFPHVELWRLSSDILLIGSERPVPVDYAATVARLRDKKVAADLKRIGLSKATTLFALHTADDRFVDSIRRTPGPINDDMFPVLEYSAPKALFSRESANFIEDRDLRISPTHERLHLTRFLKARGHGMRRDEYAEIHNYLKLTQSGIRARFLNAWLNDYPQDEKAMWAQVAEDLKYNNFTRARETLKRLLAIAPNNGNYLKAAAEAEMIFFTRRRSYLNRTSPTAALKLFKRLQKADPKKAFYALRRMSMIYEEDGDIRSAAKYLEQAAVAGENLGKDARLTEPLRQRARQLLNAKGL